MCKRWKHFSFLAVAAILLSTFIPGFVFAATITVDESTQYQTIDGFGAFGLRNVNWANPSEWWNDSFGDLIISDLGLTIHRNEYYPPEGDQDTQFSAQAPYYQLLRDKAIQHGEPLKIVITYWTPPSYMKDNGSPDGGSLLPEYYDDLGNYTVDARDDFAGIGVDVYAWSLQNEPLFPEPYNSCVYTAEQYRDMFKIAAPIIHNSYPDLKLFGDEHMLWGITRDWDWANTSAIRKVKDDSLANSHMGIWAVHGYSDGISPDPASQAEWVLARQRLDIDNTGRHFWMTETSGFSTDWSGAWTLGTQIFSGLKYGHLSAWVFWQLSNDTGGEYALMQLGNPTKRYYVSKQFYRYIRPDAVMVEADTDQSGVYAAAFTHSANQTLTIVLINDSGSQRTLDISIGGSIIPDNFDVYRTTSGENCVNAGTISSSGPVTVPNSSITTLYGVGGAPQPPGQASNPSPANGATDISVEADISWTAGSGADSHDVYFGQDSTPDSGEFQGNQTGTTFDPGTLAASTTYYWRIDSVNTAGTTTGSVWSFTTEAAPQPPGQASNPSPADGATGVNTTVTLSWSAGSGAISHDVYFGTDPTPDSGEFQGNQTGTTFDPGTLANDTTYYWRIDEKNAVGTTTGVVWSFTTRPGAGSGTGLQGDYYDNIDFTAFVLSRVDPTVNFNWGSGSPDPSIGADTFSVRWTGFVEPLYSETYTFYTNSDDGVRLWVDGQLVVENWTDHAPTENSGTIALTAGTQYDIQMDYYENGGGAVAELRWSSANQTKEIIPQTQLYEPTAPPPPGQATNPSPADAATGVDINADLSWTAGSGADSHDVYFGTTSPGTFQGNQTSTTFDPGTMANDTIYYWRIDEKNAGGTTTGVVWSFTTESVLPPGQATNPSPADGATDVSTTADLSWTAGSGATSHDVYFGTSSPGTFQGNQGGTTFDPGTLAYSTTYYWRIDEVGAGGTTTGSVWSFTTESEPGAAIEFDSVGSNSNGTNGTTLSWSHTVGSGSNRILIVGVAGEDSSGTDLNISSVTYGGVAMTLVPNSTSTEGTSYLQGTALYYLLSPTVGTATVTVTYSGSVAERSGGSISLRNADQAVAEAVATNGNTGSNSISTNITTQTNGAWVIDVVGCGNSGSYTATGGNTERYDVQNDSASAAGSTKLVASAGSTTVSWTHSGANRLAQSAAAFAPVSGPPVPPDPATNPSPANAATAVSTTATLSWTAGSGATSHDVYFGTTSPGTFQGNQTATTFDPGTMANNTTYYWRIDELNAGGTTTGVVWSFTTEPVAPPGQATNPSPADGATDVSIDVSLSWTAGSGATSHDVYFGTDSTPDSGEFKGNQTGTTFDPGTLYNDTTYYWRIDEVGDGGTTTGIVWSFTTEAATPPPGQATNPNPSNGATGVSVDADLSWTAGSGATSHDVYFGQTSPGNFQGNQTAMTFDPGTMANSTTYYWRIDEKNAVGTTTGVVWSFTTQAPLTEHYVECGGTEPYVDGQGNTWVADEGYIGGETVDRGSIEITGTTDDRIYQTERYGMSGYQFNVANDDYTVKLHFAETYFDSAGSRVFSMDVEGSQYNDLDIWVEAGGMNAALIKTFNVTVTDGVLDITFTASVNYALVNGIEFTTAAPPPPPDQATNPSPADGATDVSVDADLSWTAGSGATSHDVYFGDTTSPPFVQNQAGTTYDPGTLDEVTTYYWRIDEVGDGGTTTGDVWSFTTAAASEWISQDIGSPGVAGSASETAGTWTLNGDGSDISGTSDSFHYVYQSVSGDCEIIARVVSFTSITADWAKAGLMFRETLAANSTYALNNYTTNVARTVNSWTILHRDTTGGDSTQTVWGTSQSPPYWMRLVRSGNSFSAYVSSNGSSWTLIDTVTVNMATNIYVGMAVTSHDSGSLSTGTFDNVQIIGG